MEADRAFQIHHAGNFWSWHLAGLLAVRLIYFFMLVILQAFLITNVSCLNTFVMIRRSSMRSFLVEDIFLCFGRLVFTYIFLDCRFQPLLMTGEATYIKTWRTIKVPATLFKLQTLRSWTFLQRILKLTWNWIDNHSHLVSTSFLALYFWLWMEQGLNVFQLANTAGKLSYCCLKAQVNFAVQFPC